MIIPETINRKRQMIDFLPHEMCVYIPIPDTIDEGFYINQSDLVALLRANKNDPESIQYISDMLE